MAGTTEETIGGVGIFPFSHGLRRQHEEWSKNTQILYSYRAGAGAGGRETWEPCSRRPFLSRLNKSLRREWPVRTEAAHLWATVTGPVFGRSDSVR